MWQLRVCNNISRVLWLKMHLSLEPYLPIALLSSNTFSCMEKRRRGKRRKTAPIWYTVLGCKWDFKVPLKRSARELI